MNQYKRCQGITTKNTAFLFHERGDSHAHETGKEVNFTLRHNLSIRQLHKIKHVQYGTCALGLRMHPCTFEYKNTE